MNKIHSNKLRLFPLLRIIVAAIVLVLVTLFWWLWHPEILNYQEQYQMFQTTGSYLVSHLSVAGGVSVYIAEFITQFNLYPFVGSLFIALQMVAVMLLADRLINKIGNSNAVRYLAICASISLVVLMCWMMGDENLLPSFLTSVVLVLAGINIIFLSKRLATRIVVAIFILPALLWMCGERHYRIPHQFLSAPGFNPEKTEVLEYDMFVRQCDWSAIIKKAEEHKPSHPLSIQALNLALAKKQWLCDRMFEFNQIGVEGLMYPWRNNSFEGIISSEVAWHVGFVNTAYRLSFDSQEAIPDKRRSARLTKRMVECCIVNGDYSIARKFLNSLKNTLMYSKWAERAEAVLGDDSKVATHPIWGEKRNLRPRQEYFFYYPELPKLFALIATESNGKNQIAWDYFNAAVMLKGDLETFVGMSHYSHEMFGKAILPRHQQEAWAFFWTSTHPSFEGIPEAVANDIQQRISSFASKFMQSKGQFTGFEKDYSDTYWLYFLKKQQKSAQSQETDGITSATQ